jgi:hypothetical protein
MPTIGSKRRSNRRTLLVRMIRLQRLSEQTIRQRRFSSQRLCSRVDAHMVAILLRKVRPQTASRGRSSLLHFGAQLWYQLWQKKDLNSSKVGITLNNRFYCNHLKTLDDSSTEKVRKTPQISPNNRNSTEQRERKSLIPNNCFCDALICKQGVGSSSLPTSTNSFSDCKVLIRFISAPIPLFWFLLCTNCARTAYWTVTVHIGAAIKASATGSISLARRLSFSRASRFICNFI